MHAEMAITSDEEEDEFASHVTLQMISRFVSDFEHTTHILLCELQSTLDISVFLETFMTIHHQQHTQERQAIIESDLIEEQRGFLEKYECEFLPLVVQLFMSHPQLLRTLSTFDHFQQFLQYFMQVIVTRLYGGYAMPRTPAALLETLNWILDDTQSFYSCYQSLGQQKGLADDGTLSPFFENLQFWSEINGFQLFLYVLSSFCGLEECDSEPNLTNDIIRSNDFSTLARVSLMEEAYPIIFRILYTIKDHVSNAFASQYFESLVQALDTFVKHFTAEEFGMCSRDTMSEAFQVLECWLSKLQDNAQNPDSPTSTYPLDATEYYENSLIAFYILRLSIGQRSMDCAALEKQIFGISEFGSVLVYAQISAPESVQQALQEWIESQRVIDKLFHEHTHDEIVRRCAPLLRYLNDAKALNPNKLQKLWDFYLSRCTMSQHASEREIEASSGLIIESAQQLLLELCEFASDQVLHDLFKLIQAHDVSSHSHLVQLLVAMARRAQDFNETRLFTDILDVLYPCLASVPSTLYLLGDVVPTLLEKAFSGSAMNPMEAFNIDASLPKWLHSCMEISQTKNVEAIALSMEALTALLTSVADVASNHSTWLLSLLQRQCFIFQAQETRPALAFIHSLLAILERIVDSPQTHASRAFESTLRALERTWKLDTMLASLTESSTSPGFTHIELERIWRAACNSHNVPILFQYWSKCSQQLHPSLPPLMTPDLARFVLSLSFSNLDSTQITREASHSFRCLFELANGTKSFPNVDRKELYGMQELWNLVFSAYTVPEAEEFSVFLSELFSFHRPFEFIEHCMTILIKAKTRVESLDTDTQDAYETVVRCINLLRFFLDTYSDVEKDHSSATFHENLQHIGILPSPRMHTKTRRASCLHPDKPRVSQRRTSLHLPSPLSPDDGGPNLAFIHLDTAFHPSISSTRNEQRYSSIAQELANHSIYFQVLLDLIDWESAPFMTVSARAWELLSRLPFNDEILQGIIHQSTYALPSWPSLLDTQHLHRLLYALRLVEALLLSHESAERPEIARRQWRERFVRLGGLQHVSDSIISWKQCALQSHYERNLNATCLAALLEILCYFLDCHLFPNHFQLRQSRENAELYAHALQLDARLWKETLPRYFEDKSKDSAYMCWCVDVICPLCVNMEEKGPEGCQTLAMHVILLYTHLLTKEFLESHRTMDSDATLRLYHILQALYVDCNCAQVRKQSLNLFYRFLSACYGPQALPNANKNSFLVSFLLSSLKLLHDACTKPSHAYPIELSILFQHVLENILSDPVYLWCVQQLEALLLHKPLQLLSTFSNYISSLAQEPPSLPSRTAFKSAVQLLTWLSNSTSAFASALSSIDLIPLIFGSSNQSPWVPIFDSDTRNVAYDLLLALSPHTNMLSSLQLIQARAIDTLSLHAYPWNLDPALFMQPDTISRITPGLVNPGCICYMNALLQQLFRLSHFRRTILQHSFSNSAIAKTESLYEMQALQKLFIGMSYSNAFAIDPSFFAMAHMDSDGNPTDMHMQMDAYEFFCLLLDRLELLLLPETESCFNGKLAHQITTLNGHVSTREERFFAMSLELTKSATLMDSLALYVQNELLNGSNAYYSEQEKRKVDAVKRIKLHTLPNVLVFHLKRFTFDFDTMDKLKVNDALHFPLQVDMSPFLLDSAEKQSVYRLKGTIVHAGSSDTGHYYSIVRGNAENTWLEVNDSIVRERETSVMEKECFGGQELVQEFDIRTQRYVHCWQYKKQNAYMLIYESEDQNVEQDMEIHPSLLPLIRSVTQANEERRALAMVMTASYAKLMEKLSAKLHDRTLLSQTWLDMSEWQALNSRILGCDTCSLALRTSEWLFGIAIYANWEDSAESAITAVSHSLCTFLNRTNEPFTLVLSAFILHQQVQPRVQGIMPRCRLSDTLLFSSDTIKSAWKLVIRACLEKLIQSAWPFPDLILSAWKSFYARLLTLFWHRQSYSLQDPSSIAFHVFANDPESSSFNTVITQDRTLSMRTEIGKLLELSARAGGNTILAWESDFIQRFLEHAHGLASLLRASTLDIEIAIVCALCEKRKALLTKLLVSHKSLLQHKAIQPAMIALHVSCLSREEHENRRLLDVYAHLMEQYEGEALHVFLRFLSGVLSALEEIETAQKMRSLYAQLFSKNYILEWTQRRDEKTLNMLEFTVLQCQKSNLLCEFFNDELKAQKERILSELSAMAREKRFHSAIALYSRARQVLSGPEDNQSVKQDPQQESEDENADNKLHHTTIAAPLHLSRSYRARLELNLKKT